MRQLVLENMRKFRGHRAKTTDGNPQLSVVHGTGPARRMRDIEECLLRIQRHENIVVGRSAEVPDQIVVVRFECCNNLPSKCFRRLLALVMKSEMLTLALRKL